MKQIVYFILMLLLTSQAMAASLQEQARTSDSLEEKQVVKSFDGSYVKTTTSDGVDYKKISATKTAEGIVSLTILPPE